MNSLNSSHHPLLSVRLCCLKFMSSWISHYDFKLTSMYPCLGFICEQIKSQNDDGQRDASRQECNICGEIITSLLFHVLYSDRHICVYMHTLFYSFCLFHLLFLCKINLEWSIRLLSCCIWEKMMQFFTQFLHTPGIWVRGPCNWTLCKHETSYILICNGFTTWFNFYFMPFLLLYSTFSEN